MKHFYLSFLLFFVVTVIQAQIPVLNSYRVSTPSRPVPTIYLDFDGYVIDSSSVWFGYPNQVTRLEGAKLTPQQIVEVFEIVSEDYRPFQVNVTTDSAAFETAPINRRLKVVITSSSEWYPGYYGGAAFIGSFSWGDDSPAMVWSNNLSFSPKYVAEATSHEAGHGLGLNHHGIYQEDCSRTHEYHNGSYGTSPETTWGPIMGSVYYSNVTTWYYGDPCKGSERELDHDLKIIKEVVSQRADDYPSAGTLLENTSDTAFYVSGTGLIETRTDSDFVKFVIPKDMRVSIGASPEKNYNSISNLDVRLRLKDDKGKNISYQPSGSLSIFIDTTLKAGTYSMYIAGDGDELYTNYGSLGMYKFFVDSRRPEIKVDLGADMKLCFDNTPVKLDAKNEVFGSTISYLWNTGETTRTIMANYGTYWVTVTDLKSGAEVRDTIVIEEIPEVVVDFSYETPVSTCGKKVVSFSDKTYIACGNPELDYFWDFGDGKSSGKVGDVTHEYAKPGTYYVSLHVSSRMGPGYFVASYDVVIPEPRLPSVRLIASGEICRNNAVTLTASTNETATPAYRWSTGATTQSINITRTGRYWVRMTTADGCITSDTMVVAASNGTLPDFNIEKQGLRTVAFTDKSVPCNLSGEIENWHWDFGDLSTSNEKNPTHFYKKPGVYIVSLTTSNEFGEKTILKDVSVGGEIENNLYQGDRLKIPSRGKRIRIGANIIIDIPSVIRQEIFSVESSSRVAYQLININGQVLSKGVLVPGINKVVADRIERGVFFMAVHTSEGIQTVRIVKM